MTLIKDNADTEPPQPALSLSDKKKKGGDVVHELCMNECINSQASDVRSSCFQHYCHVCLIPSRIYSINHHRE